MVHSWRSGWAGHRLGSCKQGGEDARAGRNGEQSGVMATAPSTGSEEATLKSGKETGDRHDGNQCLTKMRHH